MKILGIDLGGQSIKIGIVQNGQIIKQKIIKTNLKNIFGNLKNELKSFWDVDIKLVGLALPGFVKKDKKTVKLSGNLNLSNFNIDLEIKKIINTNIETFVLNDANAATLGEHAYGKGQGVKSMIMYTIGTGVGGGLIINNEIVEGAQGYAGEFGHHGEFQTTKKCTCGLKLCLEPISSAPGIENEISKQIHKKVELKNILPEQLLSNPKINKAFKIALKPLASHIAIMISAINPELILIGGGPSNFGKPLLEIIKKLVNEYTLDFYQNSTKIEIAQLKNDAGILGAAYWAKINNEKKEGRNKY